MVTQRGESLGLEIFVATSETSHHTNLHTLPSLTRSQCSCLSGFFSVLYGNQICSQLRTFAFIFPLPWELSLQMSLWLTPLLPLDFSWNVTFTVRPSLTMQFRITALHLNLLIPSIPFSALFFYCYLTYCFTYLFCFLNPLTIATSS